MNFDGTYMILLLLEQERIADLLFLLLQVLYTLSFQALKQSHETKVVCYRMIVQTCFSSPLV